MRFQVDLDTCQNHGQCCLLAPKVFSLGEDSRQLVLRHEAEHRYVSPEIDESQREDVTAASEMCPTQAIEVID
jgi:ferredoxin